MIPKRLKDFYENNIKLRKYNNVVDAAHLAMLMRLVTGISVLQVVSLPGNRIVSRFSVAGFVFFILWSSIYFFCTYKTHYEDQTILRMLYSTKLKRYGDDFERTSSLLYVLVTLVLTPFKLSGNCTMMQQIVDIDSVIEKAGYLTDFNKVARMALKVTLGQVIVYLARLICVFVSLSSCVTLPLENIYQVVYCDALALVTTALYCYHLIILRDRFKWINKTLGEIKKRNSWEYKVFVRGKVPANMIKVVELQDQHVCKKIKICARVYSMLFHSCQLTNRIFGLALLLIMLHYFNYIILYLFYFMEATASGMFHDVPKYLAFLLYIFWEIVIAQGIICMIVIFCECTMDHAKKTSHLTHEIINEGMSAAINNEAMQLSIQLLHEVPIFSVCGFFNLDYAYLQQGARSVCTYLIILLQFVTENTSEK